MPRVARIKAENQIYHIIQRRNERKNIFLSDDDRARFLDTLERMKKKYNFKLEAYCLMDNHVHLLVEDIKFPSAIISLNTSLGNTLIKILLSDLESFSNSCQKGASYFT